MKKLFLLIFFSLLFIDSYGQHPVLTLTKKEMYADFDTLVTNIKTVSPHIAIKKDLWRYDALAEISALRKQIDTVSSDFSFYILIRKVLNASQDMHTSFQDFNPDEMTKIESSFRMYLPVFYKDGTYFVREAFRVGQDTIFTGTKITHINGLMVDDYIKRHLCDRYYSYDMTFKKFYSAGFFKNLETIFQDQAVFTFMDAKGRTKQVTIKTRDKFNYLKHSSIFPDTTKIEYWQDQKALYIRLVEMDRQVIPYLSRQLDKYRNYQDKFNKVIIDIRNNPGGEDTIWQALYAKIIAKPVSYRLKIDNYRQTAPGIKKESDPLLARYHLYTIIDTTETLAPDSSSIRFKGKIFVLAENIYSSAGSSMVIPNAYHNDQIYSIGRKSGFFLGVGFSPLNFELPNSKMTYRIAPSINVTDVKKLPDLMHDQNEIDLPVTLQEFIDKEKYYGNLFGKDFLINYDPFVRKALSL